MVIKKPYAFLIKKFKVIHAVLFIMLLYLVICSFNVFSFFNNYANNNFIMSLDLVYSSINLFTFLTNILILLISISIYYLLSKKNKPKKMYLFMCIYFVFLFIYFIVNLSFLKDLEYNNFSYEKVRVIRDFWIIMLVPQITFSVMALFRTLGFNIKEFDFKKDIDKLEIDEKDFEEVEITLGKENYKYAREVRKSFRLFKYFMQENKFFITIVLSIIALIVSLVVFLNLRIYNLHYNETQEFRANAVWYTIDESYLAYKDVNGNIINNGRYYLLVKVNMKNKLNINVTVDRDSFRLKLNNNLYVPKFSYGDKFLDVGETFSQAVLLPGVSKSAVVVFELDETQIRSEYILRVKNADYVKLGELNSEYVDIVVKPKNINSDVDKGRFSIPSKINLKDTILNNTKLTVDSIEISNSFKGQYESCYNNSCSKYSYVIKPSGIGGAVLKIKANITMDNNNYIGNYVKYPNTFFKYFSKIYYRVEGEIKELNIKTIDSAYGKDNFAYIEVPEKFKYADKIEMLINIRGVKYTLVLK